jgi:hypothetical protein
MLIAAMQKYQLGVIIQHGENERCNSNDLFKVHRYVAVAQCIVSYETSSQMEDGEFDEIKTS